MPYLIWGAGSLLIGGGVKMFGSGVKDATEGSTDFLLVAGLIGAAYFAAKHKELI